MKGDVSKQMRGDVKTSKQKCQNSKQVMRGVKTFKGRFLNMQERLHRILSKHVGGGVKSSKGRCQNV